MLFIVWGRGKESELIGTRDLGLGGTRTGAFLDLSGVGPPREISPGRKRGGHDLINGRGRINKIGKWKGTCRERERKGDQMEMKWPGLVVEPHTDCFFFLPFLPSKGFSLLSVWRI